MNSALASLTETYTDSENEDNHEDVLYSDPEEKQIKAEIVVQKNHPNKPIRLVSNYDHDEIFENEEEDRGQHTGTDNVLGDDVEMTEQEDAYAKYSKKYGFQLPPEPKIKTKTNQQLQEKVLSMTQKMANNPNYDLNQYIQKEKKFRNPSIYDKLIQYCGLNELGTNFPPEIYDVSIFPPESYYEELSKAQKNEMDKHEKMKKENKTAEIVIKEGKRKTKWDMQPQNTTASSGKTNQAVLINAFGTLKKK